MSTTKELKVRRSLPYNINIRANGKYDYTTTHTFKTDNEQLSYEMQDYDGLKYTINKPSGEGTTILDFSKTILPWKFEMNRYLATTKYCLKPYRETPYDVEHLTKKYAKFNINGSPTISNDIVSNFSEYNYLTLKTAFKPQGAWEIVLKFKMNESAGREQGLFGYNGTGLFKICLGGNNRMILSLSTVNNDWNIGEITGTTDIELNKFYWVKAEFNGNIYKLSLSDNGIDYNLEGTLETSSIPVFPNTTFIGVVNRNYNSLAGSIDLSESYIKQKEISVEGEGELIEQAFTQPILSQNGTMGGGNFAVSADDDTVATKLAYYAFDNNDDTFWRGGNVPGYIDFYNPAPIKVTSITWGFFYSYPTSGNVQGSNDYLDWTTITDFTNDSEGDFTIDMSGNTNSYKYYRINVSSVNMDVLHCKQLTIVGTVKGYAVDVTYGLADCIYVKESVINYNIVGTPIFNGNVVSGFSSSNYLTIKRELISNNNATYVLKFTTGDDITTDQVIMQKRYFIDIEISASEGVLFYTWSPSRRTSLFTPQPNTTYWLKVVINGMSRTYSYSTNGVDYSEGITVEDYSLSTTDSSNLCLGLHSVQLANPFQGSIDVYDSYVLINGETNYLASSATEQLYGIIDGTDFSSDKPVYCYANRDERVVLRNTKTEKLDTSDWYLGEVEIS